MRKKTNSFALFAGTHFPKGGKKTFDGKSFRLMSVHKTKSTAIKDKKMFIRQRKYVRIWKGSGAFPYHVFVRNR